MNRKREEAEAEAKSTRAASGSSIYFSFLFFLRILQLLEQGNEPSDCTESDYQAMFRDDDDDVV
jgi:hypothetical protein